MTYLLDTNVVSELRKAEAGRADMGVTSWAKGVPPTNLFLSVITVLELEAGILLLERKDKPQALILRSWLESCVLMAFEGRILPVDTEVARRCAGLHAPNRLAYRDAMIAATALVHGLIVVTRNIKDFEPAGVKTLNPWSAWKPSPIRP